MEPNNQQEPIISEEEMKMPEDAFSSNVGGSDKSTHLGVILGILIVILVLILGGLYLWGTTMQNGSDLPAPTAQRPTDEENNEPESTNAEADVDTSAALSTSNELDAIEADIESTNLDQLDAELDTIDAELDTI